MNNLDQQIAQAQEEWDTATYAYSRYPGAEQWQAFLKAQQKVLTLHRQREVPDKLVPSLPSTSDEFTSSSQNAPTSVLKTSDILYAFLQTVDQATNKQMVQACNLTDDKVRHGLLSLLKQQKIEKLAVSVYKVISFSSL